MLGLAVGYVWFFIWPVFLSGPSMHLPAPVVTITPIGTDLRQTLNAAKAWFARGGSPYFSTVWYPPLTYLLLEPVILLPTSLRYPVVTALSLLAYVGASLLFPLGLSKDRKASPELILIFTTGLLSYGFLFEIERVQLTMIAAALVFWSIWLRRQRAPAYLWSYLLFTIAIQLKLWPAFFVPVLMLGLKNIRQMLLHLGALGVVNAALLVMFYPAASAADLIRLIRSEVSTIEMNWIGNHSIRSFMSQFADRATLHGYSWIASNITLLQWALVLGVVALLGASMIASWHRGRSDIDPDLLLACTLAALLLPVQSNDYTLVILVGPVAIFLSNLRARLNSLSRPGFAHIGTAVFSLAYSATLFPVSTKPHNLVLANSFPALLVMLLAVTILGLFLPRQGETAPTASAGFAIGLDKPLADEPVRALPQAD
jgi:hypothetical protein